MDQRILRRQRRTADLPGAPRPALASPRLTAGVVVPAAVLCEMLAGNELHPKLATLGMGRWSPRRASLLDRQPEILSDRLEDLDRNPTTSSPGKGQAELRLRLQRPSRGVAQSSAKYGASEQIAQLHAGSIEALFDSWSSIQGSQQALGLRNVDTALPHRPDQDVERCRGSRVAHLSRDSSNHSPLIRSDHISAR